MKNELNSIEELFEAADKFTDIMQEIDKIIVNTAPKFERKFFHEGSFTGIGYNFVPYKTSCYDGLWPVILLTFQKNYVSLYVMKFIDGKSLVKEYSEIFGKSNVGQSCIRIRKLDQAKKDTIKEIVIRCV